MGGLLTTMTQSHAIKATDGPPPAEPPSWRLLSNLNRTAKYLHWRHARVPSIFLPSALGAWRRVELLKMDCELCEYDVIASAGAWFTDRRTVTFVGGELHNGARIPGALREAVRKALAKRGCREHSLLC
jgi:hypothetical protein